MNYKRVREDEQRRLNFSVITIVLNGENVIEKTITSVLHQTSLPYEYLIIDGKSTDRTVEIAESFSPLFAEKGVRYSVLSEKDSGHTNAANKGIDLATGEFISFLNAGDWYEEDALQKIQSFYDEEPFDLTYGGINYINEDGTIRKKMSRLDHFPVSTRNWNHPSMFLRRELYLKYKFDETLVVMDDFDLYLKLRRSGVKIRVINEVITNFAVGGLSTDPDIKKVLWRAAAKYRVYKRNGYSSVYWLEAYGWEFLKNLYIRWHRFRAVH